MKIRILSTLALSAILFMGCQKDDVAPNTSYPEDGVVRIATSINALQTRTTPTDYAGTNLSLTVDYGDGDGDTYTKKNVQWTKSGTTWSTTDMMLWKNATASAKIYAYAPYVTSAESNLGAVAFTAAIDQSTPENLTASDLVGYVNTNFTPNEGLVGGAIPIAFDHKMSKLTIKLKFGNEFTSPEVASVIVNAKNAVTYNAKTAIAAESGNAVAIKANGSEVTYTAIVSPQTIGASAKFITIAIGEDTYTYTVAAAGHKFVSNTNNTINLRVGKDKIELGSEITVGAWNDNSQITGGEALPVFPANASVFGETIEIDLGSEITTSEIVWTDGKDETIAKSLEPTVTKKECTTYNFAVPANITTTTWKKTTTSSSTEIDGFPSGEITDAAISNESDPDAIPTFTAGVERKFVGTIAGVLHVEITQDAGSVGYEYYGRYGSPLQENEKTGKNAGHTRKRAVITTVDAKDKMNWSGADRYCTDLVAGSFDDWSLPAQTQLAGAWVAHNALTDFTANYYWSSTGYGNISSYSWDVNFDNGGVSGNYELSVFSVRCVRDL